MFFDIFDRLVYIPFFDKGKATRNQTTTFEFRIGVILDSYFVHRSCAYFTVIRCKFGNKYKIQIFAKIIYTFEPEIITYRTRIRLTGMHRKILIFCFFILVSTSLSAQENKVVTLLPDAFNAAIQQAESPLIFDVRDNAFYKKYKIPGALHMPDKATLRSCTDTLDHDTPIFVYCEVGFMSRIVSNLLVEEGFNAVHTLEKGINRWHKLGYPVEKISKRKKQKKS